MTRLGFAGIAAIALVAGAFPASGQTFISQTVYGTQRSVVVHFADLNVGRPDGASALLGRLHAATRNACADANDIRDLGMQAIYVSCLNRTMDRAVADASAHAPMVADLYFGRPFAVAQNVSKPGLRHVARGSGHRRHIAARALPRRG